MLRTFFLKHNTVVLHLSTALIGAAIAFGVSAAVTADTHLLWAFFGTDAVAFAISTCAYKFTRDHLFETMAQVERDLGLSP